MFLIMGNAGFISSTVPLRSLSAPICLMSRGSLLTRFLDSLVPAVGAS